MSVRTRFAPSPTGYMHIGGMRTALFNWLWARHHGGTFILRIDDTDQQRNIDEALGPILQAFRWLGLDWDEGPEVGGPHGPYYQSQRGDLYRAAAQRLLETGHAYRDFETPEEIKAQREAAEKEKRSYLSARTSLQLSPQQVEQYVAEGKPHVVRFLVPRDRKVKITDHVRGEVEWDAGLMPDPVILRGDGSPLYNFATVVDDAALEITHVIRAEEHLTNTAVQVLIYEALGYPQPEFAHIPYVAAPGSKEKLSKRKLDKYRKNPQFKKMFEKADTLLPRLGLGGKAGLDPVMVEYYEAIGYLPEAIINALARLGWSLDDKTEIMSRQTIVENFTLDRVIKAPAGFDPDKLDSFQAHWMGQLPVEEKVARCLPYLTRAGLLKGGGWQPAGASASPDVDPAIREYLTRVVTTIGDRLKVFGDILEFDEFFVADEQLAYDEKALEKRLREPGAEDLLRKLRDRLAATEPWETAALEQATKSFIEAEGLKLGQIIHALRVATTGKTTGVGMFEALDLLGRERTLNRIDRTLGRV